MSDEGVAASPSGVHTEHEDMPWTIDVGDHAQRSDSPGYVRSRKLMIEFERREAKS